MTRKDYEAFAAMICGNKRSLGYHHDDYLDGRVDGYNDALEDMALDMCRIFEADNDRFDKKRFMEACGL